LMVIQNACPRFSLITLLPVMALLACSLCSQGSICDGIADDCKRDLG
jgi:hypothetical protein